MVPHPRPTTRRFFQGLAFALPLCIYLLTAAPGLTWAHHGADGGDLISAAYRLGVPHPPGYPTYTGLAWLFTRLPLGSVAWRVHLLSVVSTAAAAALIYHIVHVIAHPAHDSGPATVAGLGAAWSYAFAPLVWGQALIAEVYAPAGLWTALLLWLALRATRRPTRSSALSLGLVWSLGLGVHLTLLALAPVVVWAVGWARSKTWRWAAAGFGAGLLVWLYLPWRAGRGGFTWGDPTTPAGFWWLASGALYRHYPFALPASALPDRLAAWAQTWTRGLGLTGVGLATLGVARQAGRQRGWLAATGSSFVILNLYALGYNTTDSVVYLVPVFVIASTWLGVGLLDLFDQLRGRRWLTPAILILALATPAWTLALNGAALNLRGDHRAEDFAAVIRKAPPRAILWSTTDRQTFALWYAQRVQGWRPDVVVIDAGLYELDWYREQLEERHGEVFGAAATPDDGRPRCHVRHENREDWLDCQP